MKKILIVGGSHSELPLVLEAKKLGLYTICVGNINGNAHLEADESYLYDYSDRDLILKLAIEKNIDYICFGAHDISMRTTAYIAEKLGFRQFDSLETTIKLHQKDLFKKIALKYNLNVVKSYNKDDEIEFPVIVKPVDMGGGKGISVANNYNELKKAINLALKFSNKYIIEKFFRGNLHSLSTFIIDKKIKFFYSDNEYPCENNQFGVCLSIADTLEFNLIKHSLLKEIEKIADIFDLKNGLLHIQYLQNKNQYKIVEITRRMPGDIYNIPVEMATNFPYAQYIIRFAIGENVDIYFNEQNKITGRFCVIDKNIIPEKNIIKKVKILNSLKKEIVFFQFSASEKNEFLKENKFDTI